MWASVVSGAVGLAVLAILFSPRLRHSKTWQATVTPLASIIGSGFLVSVPLLAGEVGNWAFFAMAALVIAAYFIGSAIRFNIRYAEPLLNQADRDPWLLSMERLSHFTLVLAYFVSVAYYLLLLANFLLKGLGVNDPMLAKLITTAILLSIGSIGLWRGLEAIEHLAKYSVDIKLAIIAAVLAGLVWYNGTLVTTGDWSLATLSPNMNGDTLRIVLGLLIMVQGFETSRFLGEEYSRDLRIRTMRNAQLISGAIYLVFFALVTVLFRFEMKGIEVAAIIDLVSHVALILPLVLTIGAIASQFSAAIADSIGAAGLIHDVSEKTVSTRHSYPITALVAIALVWGTDVFGIITLASRAFALYYLIQCLVALYLAIQKPDLPGRTRHITLYASTALLCTIVVLFAIPSSGG